MTQAPGHTSVTRPLVNIGRGSPPEERPPTELKVLLRAGIPRVWEALEISTLKSPLIEILKISFFTGAGITSVVGATR